MEECKLKYKTAENNTVLYW